MPLLRSVMSLPGSVGRDIRHASRLFVKSPGFVAIAVVSIAFGTGANVAIFSATDALLLRPLPVARPDELLTVGTQIARGREVYTVASYPDFTDIRDRSRAFAGLAALTSRAVPYAARPDAVSRPQVASFVNADFFRALDIQPLIGRTFQREDDVAGRDAVTILSHGLWQRDFAGDAAAIGRTVRMSGVELTVVGVLPETFTGLEPRYVRDAAYVPLAMFPRIAEADPDNPSISGAASGNPLRRRDLRMLAVKGRLKPGVTMTQASAELEAISRDLARENPETNARTSFAVQTELQTRMAQETFDVGLVLIFSVLSTAVLGVACANVAGLLASRATVRGREIALRLAIGAGRARIVRQLLVESILISAAGALFGLGVGYAGIRLLNQIRMPTDVFAYPEFRLDERALIFTLAVAVASALLFGLAPALQTVRVDLVSGLKSGAPRSIASRRLSGRRALVTTQVALSLVLLSIAVSTFETFRRQLDKGSGFRNERSVKVTLDAGRRSPAETVRFFERVVHAARDVPGVTSATLTSAMPLFSYQPGALVPEGFHLPPGESAVNTFINCVDEGYFETMEIPIVRGRGFLPTDAAETPRVAIVNELVAGQFWPGQDAVGRRFRLNDARGPLVEVVGIARMSKYHYFLEPPTQMIYLPFRQEPRAQMVVVAATAAASATTLPGLGAAVSDIDPDAPVSDLQTMEGFYAARTTMFSVLGLRLVGSMGVMGMVLTIIGLYGLVSYDASRRTREIGIRIAIGATAARVVRLILNQGLRPAWYGLAVGLIASTATARLLAALIPLEHHGGSRAQYLAVPVLLGVSVLAAFIPARRSSRVDPTVALRSE
jgi:putative ABC transport system permease protein